MSLHFTGEPQRPLFPASLEDRLRGLAGRATGLVLLAIAAAGWASLVSWSATDPSLSHATSGAVKNVAGPWGAIAADLMLQLLGFSAVVAFIAPMFWAMELLAVRRVSDVRIKLIFYPLSVLILAGAMAAVPVPSSWPLHHGLGGILGDFIYNAVTSLFAALNPARAGAAAGLVLFATGLAAVACSIGLNLRDFAALLGACAGRSGWRTPRCAAPYVPGPAAPPCSSLSLTPERRTYPEPSLELPPDPPRASWPTARRREPSLGGPRAAHAKCDPELEAGAAGVEDAPDIDDVTDEASRAIAKRFAPQTLLSSFSQPPPAEAPAPELPPIALDAPKADAAPRERARPRAGSAAEKRVAPSYRPPSLNMLKRPTPSKAGPEFTQAALRGNARLLEDVLADFGIKGEVREIKPGPVVTLFELEPARGIKSARVISLADDIARSMSATSVRVAIVPGRNVIGIELPNARREAVLLREMLESEAFSASDAALPLALGKSIGGEPIVADLARMPHLLVAGTTGSGKSVGVNAMVLSLLYRHGPEDCRLLMIDPKMLELSTYNGIPHLVTPVVTEPQKAVAALNWAVREMEERYKRMAQLAVRNIDVFNSRVRSAKQRGETITRTVQTGFDRATGQAIYEQEELKLEPMPYIVIVVDEFADLMMVAGKEIEAAVQRLAQMARAAGIHLVMATQRPSVDVITGTIKANFPTRISFKVTSKIDSRTIVNEQGAEQLLGSGDMLYSTGSGQILRVHGPFVSDEEVESIAEALREQGEPRYVEGVTDVPIASGTGIEEPRGQSDDDLYDRAVAVVLRDRKASTSYLQRRLGIGYNRAADLIERMEREGLVSPANAVGKREILVGASGIDAA